MYHLLAFNRKDVSAYNQVDENKKAVCSSEEETCTDCDAGLYQDEAGQQERKERTGTLVNATTCEACTAGRFVSVTHQHTSPMHQLATYVQRATPELHKNNVKTSQIFMIQSTLIMNRQAVRIAPLDSRMLAYNTHANPQWSILDRR